MRAFDGMHTVDGLQSNAITFVAVLSACRRGSPMQLWWNLIAGRPMLVLIRVESLKLPLLLWTDEELVLWERNDMWMTRIRLVQLHGNSLCGDERVNSKKSNHFRYLLLSL